MTSTTVTGPLKRPNPIRKLPFHPCGMMNCPRILLTFVCTLSPRLATPHKHVEPTFYSSVYHQRRRHLSSRTKGHPIDATFRNATIYNGDYEGQTDEDGHSIVYDRPRSRPIRRSDVAPNTEAPITNASSSLRYVNYGTEGHPYERAWRLRDEREEGRRRRRERKLEEESGDYDNYDHEILRTLQQEELYKPLRIHFDTVSACYC